MTTQRKKIMTAADIDRSLNRIAMQILEYNHGLDDLAIIGIHTGGVFLADRIWNILQAKENREIPKGSLDISLYRDDWSLATQNPVVQKTDITFGVEGQTLILVDDVLYTGRTIRAAMDAIMDFGRPRAIQLAVLIDRGGRELPIQADFSGRQVKVSADEHVHVLLKEKGKVDEVILESIG
ncbi:MAG: bifunctional pyr operon transcriptional regulator/uracil phosphoribosyltransferase PyrR [Deltaproteobacteria bacterium CG_4_10_14_3_um_filter_60_8]|nr:MAG: bifunctional pyr operon transcriptional regulator/uracil phosphoribosyltransferase [Desulfobacterales bacterium CG2_30_60_27]PIP42831.1 MAG: bifunctional pyr operon transcriptional regulator/uracil phosphoribosyltransferase [Deltaproteobacteria bacterium CG23_combo_of_CG06-09_8_20_14_all_60_8]PIY22273.1 MAG: bifunctional pyr operon transcriptional regulator/uracil phosphoribosyltransferase PyrR [Deltaproteobacteria bacterium CG_4_10_14_3_um_filter_60_8]